MFEESVRGFKDNWYGVFPKGEEGLRTIVSRSPKVDAGGHPVLHPNGTPVIVERSGEQYEIEGCLSVPGRQGYTHRPMHVKVEALNRAGEKVTLEGEGLLARAFCHEIDHLDGILYIDHADMAVEE